MPNISLAEKIRELIIIGFNGTELTSEHLLKKLLANGLGGVIAFDQDWRHPGKTKNIESVSQIQQLNHDIKQLSAHTWRCVDSEGGRDWQDKVRYGVNRLKPQYGFADTLCAKQIGDLLVQGNLDTAKQHCELIAREIANAGFNLTMAPVADININPNSPGLGVYQRCFSKNAEIVTQAAKLFIQACKSQGVQCVLKHFPGQGSARADSHHDLVDITDSWQQQELLPYQYLANDCGIVMAAHVIHRNYDSWPATLSPIVLQQLLRKELGFDGIIMTDDLNMHGVVNVIKHHYQKELDQLDQTDHHRFIQTQLIKHALLAGNDILVFGFQLETFQPNFVDDFVATVMQLIADKAITQAQIEQSYQRIQRLKKISFTKLTGLEL